MASEEDLAEASSPAASTSRVSRADRRGASENLRCPICRAANNDRASVSWRRHPFCSYCMVEWFHKRVEGMSPFPHTFHMVGDSNSEVHSIRESISSASHTQGEQAGSHSAERCQPHSSGRQRSKSRSRSCGGSRGGSRSGSRGGSRGRAQEKSRRRYPRRHHDGRTRVQQGHSRSSSRRRRQSRARNTARDKGRAPRTKQRVSSRSTKRKVSFTEPRSRSRQRSDSSASQTMRHNLRKMERDEGQAHRRRASSRRRRRQQRRHRVSNRESQVTRSRTLGGFCSTLPLRENPRRMERCDREPLGIEQGIYPSPRRSERLNQVCFIKPRVTRSQSQARSCSTQHQTLQENLRSTECDGEQALNPNWTFQPPQSTVSTISGGARFLSLNHMWQGTDPCVGPTAMLGTSLVAHLTNKGTTVCPLTNIRNDTTLDKNRPY